MKNTDSRFLYKAKRTDNNEWIPRLIGIWNKSH